MNDIRYYEWFYKFVTRPYFGEPDEETVSEYKMKVADYLQTESFKV